MGEGGGLYLVGCCLVKKAPRKYEEFVRFGVTWAELHSKIFRAQNKSGTSIPFANWN